MTTFKEISLPFKSVCGYSDIRSLWDPIQTHAVYSVNKDDMERVKAALKELGATRFRIVKPHVPYLVIICFKHKGV